MASHKTTETPYRPSFQVWAQRRCDHQWKWVFGFDNDADRLDEASANELAEKLAKADVFEAVKLRYEGRDW